MKKTRPVLAIILLVVLTACGGSKQSTDTLITVDVNTSYPEKELILQDFMDVEYIALETTDDFITQGMVKAIGKDIILVTNRTRDGDIFVFDRTGKALRKINRFGQGGEEYSGITEIVLNEDNNEMFVVDHSGRKILVYDLYGEFKRSFPFADTSRYTHVFNYDKNHLICHKEYSPMDCEQSCHMLVSKQDGSVTREIGLPFSEIATPVVLEGEGVAVPNFNLIVPYRDSWILARSSSDTLYSYHLDGSMVPIAVRTPSVHSMELQTFLCPSVITDRYYFMQSLKKEFSFEKRKGFPITGLAYDKQEDIIFKYTVHNDDFSVKRQVYLGSRPVNPANQEVATFQALEAANLVEAYENGHLKGKLKEIVAELDEESNPVIMLVKHKMK